MAKSEVVDLTEAINGEIGEKLYIEASSALIEKIHHLSGKWKENVRAGKEPDKVRRQARQVAKAANTMEKLQESYRSPHPVEHDTRKRENFDDDQAELLIKSNKAISYVNDLGTQDFYEFDEPEEIGEGEFCVWEEAQESYGAPGEVIDEMPDEYTEDLVRLTYSGSVDDLPEFESYTMLHEV